MVRFARTGQAFSMTTVMITAAESGLRRLSGRIVSDRPDRQKSRKTQGKKRARARDSPSIIPAWVDVHGIIFVVLVLAFVVWPAAQWALDL